MINTTELIVKENKVHPETSIDQVYDKTTGEALDSIIKSMQAEIKRLKDNGYTGNFGNCKTVPAGLTKLSNLYTPGLYYLTTEEMSLITDSPKGTGNSGYVEVINRGIGDRIIYYTMNNHIYATGDRYHKIVLADGRESAWSQECHMEIGEISPVGVITGSTGKFYFDTVERKLYASLATDSYAWTLLNP